MANHHEHSVGPPVSRRAMSLAVDHLGSHVLHRPTERERLLLVEYRLLAEAEVGEFYVTVIVQKYAAQQH